MTDARAFLPLSSPQFHILLALADGPLHGYGVIRDVEQRTAGAMRETFAARCRDASARGALTLLATLGRELLDVIAGSVRSPRVPEYVESGFSRTLHRRSRSMGSVSNDLRYAFRMLRRQPGFT